MSLKKCQDCKTVYRQNEKDLGRCPSCGSGFFTLASSQDGSSKPAQKSPKEEFRPSNPLTALDASGATDIEKLITAHNKKAQDLIIAQDRTTHAVRSLAITFVATPVILVSVFFVLALSVISGSTTFIFFTAVAAIIICICVLVIALTELRRSRVY